MKNFRNKKDSKASIVEKTGKRIYTGPFSGLMIPHEAQNILSVTEILGLYESCLHSYLEALLNKQIRKIVMVGGNNGYYAAGLSYLLNPYSIVVYETAENLHPIINSWFTCNNLSAVEICGQANPEEFKSMRDIDLVFMDCEGYEVNLLDPQLFEWQRDTNILLEVHQFYIGNLVATLAGRFKDTHHIKVIYDDFQEDDKVDKILKGLDLNVAYSRHPNHRWILENGKKVYTSGMFMSLTVK